MYAETNHPHILYTYFHEYIHVCVRMCVHVHTNTHMRAQINTRSSLKAREKNSPVNVETSNSHTYILICMHAYIHTCTLCRFNAALHMYICICMYINKVCRIQELLVQVVARVVTVTVMVTVTGEVPDARPAGKESGRSCKYRKYSK